MRDVVIPTRGPGYLDLQNLEEVAHDAATIWIVNEVRIEENGVPLGSGEIVATRISLPSDRSFHDFDTALSHIRGEPLPPETELVRDQALLDVHIRYAIANESSDFAIDPGFRRLGQETTTVIRFHPPGEGMRVLEFRDDPGLVVLDPRWHQAFFRFVGTGIDHILDGIDHLLFVLCLLIPFRRIRPLVAIITSFTVAHSLTLIASAFGMVPNFLWFPPLIETLIALSIVYMAFENIVGSQWQKRWLIAFGFGLVHGFGFSFALSETLQFAG
ncbi:MAG: HupE/UreJ family protein, partial [Gammaproteobacteria bacterium]|nr:HupE/UreJ family protein [Gammaproteobacteria bacterium]